VIPFDNNFTENKRLNCPQESLRYSSLWPDFRSRDWWYAYIRRSSRITPRASYFSWKTWNLRLF